MFLFLFCWLSKLWNGLSLRRSESEYPLRSDGYSKDSLLKSRNIFLINSSTDWLLPSRQIAIESQKNKIRVTFWDVVLMLFCWLSTCICLKLWVATLKFIAALFHRKSLSRFKDFDGFVGTTWRRLCGYESSWSNYFYVTAHFKSSILVYKQLVFLTPVFHELCRLKFRFSWKFKV